MPAASNVIHPSQPCWVKAEGFREIPRTHSGRPASRIFWKMTARSLKMNFSEDPCVQRASPTGALQVSWGVLTHDLWVIAEKLREQRKIREQKLRQAA